MSAMNIRQVLERDRADWARMRHALWPGSLSDHEIEVRNHFETAAAAPIVFVAEAHDRLVGFLELDFRKYAPGCASSPVPFIEGWYVEAAVRKRGMPFFCVYLARGQMLPATKRQREILDYLNEFIAQHGYAPSLEEIGRRFGLLRSPRCTST